MQVSIQDRRIYRLLNIRVRFIGPTRTAAGTPEDTVDVSGSTVGDVVDTLADKYGDKFRQEVFQPDGSIKKSIKVFINGSSIAYDIPVRDAAVNEGDTVDIFPPFYGG